MSENPLTPGEGALVGITIGALTVQKRASTTCAILFYSFSILDGMSAAASFGSGSIGMGILWGGLSLLLWLAGAKHWKERKAAIGALEGIQKVLNGEVEEQPEE